MNTVSAIGLRVFEALHQKHLCSSVPATNRNVEVVLLSFVKVLPTGRIDLQLMDEILLGRMIVVDKK
jgi:hypothetical protein